MPFVGWMSGKALCLKVEQHSYIPWRLCSYWLTQGIMENGQQAQTTSLLMLISLCSAGIRKSFNLLFV